MPSLVRSIFSPATASRSSSRRRKGRGASGRRRDAATGAVETLEQRLAMAVAHFAQAASGAITSGWVTLISDGGDDMYAQQISPASPGQTDYVPSLIYANNASFLDRGEVANIQTYSTVFATNGSFGNNVELLGSIQSSNGYPFVQLGSFNSHFVLGHDDIDPNEPITGTISNGVGGTWDFANTPGGAAGWTFDASAFTPLGVPDGPVPESAQIVFRGKSEGSASGYFDAVLIVTWDSNSLDPGGLNVNTPPVLEEMLYDSDERGGGFFDPRRLTNVPASSFHSPLFTLPLPEAVTPGLPEYELVPGTLSGTIFVAQYGRSFDFTTASQFSQTLVFRPAGTAAPWVATQTFNTPAITGNNPRELTGRVTSRLVDNGDGSFSSIPTVALEFRAVGDDGDELQEVGPVSVDASYAFFNQPEQGIGGDFTLYPGQDFTRTLIVDLLAPGATINIESPAVGTTVSPAGHFIDLRATNTILNAEVESKTSLNIRDSFFGEAKAEQVFFNAAVASQTYDIRVGDDPLTDAVRRSKVFVSTTGSLAGDLPSSPTITPINAQTLFVLANTGDVFIEGTINATKQSYIMQSPAEPAFPGDTFGLANRGPFYLTTVAELSGANTGRIRGDSIAITLGNDLPTAYDDIGGGGSSAFNVVTLQTEITSLRIQASDRAGNAIESPFPYDVLIEEKDKLRVDAVAASTLPIVLKAQGDLNFNATLASASDVSVESVAGDLWLSAPLSTTFGSIELSARRLSVLNSVRVLDTFADEIKTDIKLTATAGDLRLVGPISAINTIELVQERDPAVTAVTGKIYGDSRLIADRLLVRADGSADIRTDVRELSGQADGGISINELDDITIPDLAAANGRVSILAAGRDYLDAEGNLTPALRATLADATTLTASTPNGSIEIFVRSAERISLGDKAAISLGTASSMVASGDVRVESLGGDIDVFDAPLAGSGARRVRVATTANLPGVYAQRTPGTFASTLTGAANGSLNALAIDGVTTLRVRDEVLVKNQGNGEENGVYTIVSLGTATSRWSLVRSADLDTTAELRTAFRCTPSEGTQGGNVYRLSEYLNAPGSTPRMVSTITNRAGAAEVRAVSTKMLDARYEFDADLGLGRITSLVDETIPQFDGVTLGLGDFVLIRLGTRNDEGAVTTASNGVYQVTSPGGDLSIWELTEVEGFPEGVVVASEGTLRALRTGLAFDVRYNSLGLAEMEFVEDAVATEIGSRDANDVVKFIVTSNGGTNLAAGSLGKMISLANQNAYLVAADDFAEDTTPTPQKQDFGFVSALRGPIRLTQELPTIERQLTIDTTLRREAVATPGVSRIWIDGSRITQKNDFTPVLPTDRIHGLEYAVGASGSSLVGVELFGFQSGAAIRLDGADDVRIDQVRVGIDELGRRSAGAVGVELVNGAGRYNTLSRSTVHSSSMAGILVDGADSSLRVVGSTIGATKFENAVGVELRNGASSIGLPPVTVALRRVSTTYTSSTTFTLPTNYVSLKTLYEGLGVISSRIVPAPGFAAATIKSISAPNASGIATITIENGSITGTSPALLVDFGLYAELEVGSTEIAMPAGLSDKDLYLGQGISSPGLPAGTTIVGLSPTTITVSRAVTAGGVQPLDIAAPGRNSVLFNNRGLMLAGGVNRVLNTDVGNSVFDGVVISGGTQAIGGGDGRVTTGSRSTAKELVFASNAIFSSGGAGIRIAPTANLATITIQGNRLGVTSANSLGVNKLGNIVGPTAFMNAIVTASFQQISFTNTPSTTLPISYTLNRVIRVTTSTAHGLDTGHKLFLTFPGASGLPNDGYAITVLSPTQFSVTVTAKTPTATPTTPPAVSGNLTFPRFGGSKTDLAKTDQRDFEGNLHGVPPTTSSFGSGSTGTGGSGATGGGVTGPQPRPVVIPRPRR